MKIILGLLMALSVMISAFASDVLKEEPVQHLIVPDVTSVEEAKRILLETSFEIASKQTLDEAELSQIHIITYSLEKSVAYFTENLTGEGQVLLQEMAVVVENIHLNSENNRKQETQEQLMEYFRLVNVFIYNYWEIKI